MKSGDWDIARHWEIGNQKQLQDPTTEARRHGERERNLETWPDPRQVQVGLDMGNAPTRCHPERARVESCETSASRRTPVLPAFVNAASGSSPHTLEPILRRLKSVWSIIHAVADEIFDESAYDRFLRQTRTMRSKESYHQFMREQEASAARRPRCC